MGEKKHAVGQHPNSLAAIEPHRIKPGAPSPALKHGTRSEYLIRPVARNHRRRVLRQLGLSPRDLDPIARGYLDLYCRVSSKVDLADRYIAEHGLLRADGEPQGVLKAYTSWVNAARLALSRLEDHLARTGKSVPPLAKLAAEGREVREQRLRAVE